MKDPVWYPLALEIRELSERLTKLENEVREDRAWTRRKVFEKELHSFAAEAKVILRKRALKGNRDPHE